MILGRVLAGVGGGGLNVMMTIIANDFIPARERGPWQALGNVFWGVGNGLGGIFGGYINDTWNWKIAFLAQIPLTLVILLMIWFQLDTIRSKSPPTHISGRALISRVDFLGSFTLVSALAVLLVGLTTGGNLVPWTHPLPCVSLPLAAVLFCAFIFVERNIAREPILPLHFLRNRTVLFACLTQFLVQCGLYVPIFYLPIYCRVRGRSSTQAGAALIPFSIAFPIGSVVTGIVIRRTGKYKNLNRTSLILILSGPLVILATVASCANRISTPLWPTLVGVGIVGLGHGSIIVLTIVALVNAVDPADSAVVTSLSYLFRSTGSVVGLALASAVYQGALERDLWTKIGDLDNAADIIRSIKNSLDEINLLPGRIQWAVRSSYMVALRATFLTAVVFSAMALITGLLIRELKLRSTLAREENGDATADEESVGK